MTQYLINIAEMKISSVPDDVLVAPNLGSCLGIAIFDKVKKIGGMIHCLLPLSSADPEKAKKNPSMYVDSGFKYLLDSIMSQGSNKKDIVIVAAGGANINDDNNIFEIGKRNHTVLKKILWKNGMVLKSEHVGDHFSRTLSLEIASGRTILKCKGNIVEI